MPQYLITTFTLFCSFLNNMVKLILVLRIGSGWGSFVRHIALLTGVSYEASTNRWRIGIFFKLKVISIIVVFIGLYSGFFVPVGADPEEERNTELVTTEEQEDEKQCEGGKENNHTDENLLRKRI